MLIYHLFACNFGYRLGVVLSDSEKEGTNGRPVCLSGIRFHEPKARDLSSS